MYTTIDPFALRKAVCKCFKPFLIYNIRRKNDKDAKLMEPILKKCHHVKYVFKPSTSLYLQKGM